jgi:hypothetical protein
MAPGVAGKENARPPARGEFANQVSPCTWWRASSIVGLLFLFIAGACSDRDNSGPSLDTSSTSSSAMATSTGASGGSQRPASPATRGPKAILFDEVTFHAPLSWDIDREGDTAFVGVLAGGVQDVMLRVERHFEGSIDTLKPRDCPREGNPPERAVSVVTVETGFRPVGNRKAEYRLWRVTCATVGVHEHRAWLLPVSKIAIYEQVHDGHPENVDVVTMADVG